MPMAVPRLSVGAWLLPHHVIVLAMQGATPATQRKRAK